MWKKLISMIYQLIGRKIITINDLQQISEVVRAINQQIQSILPIELKIIDQMTYSQAIAYFVDDRPSDKRVLKGAMLLEPYHQGQLLTQVFLDRDNNLVSQQNGKPYGRRLIVKSLDEELSRTFDGDTLVIVE